MDTLLKQRLIGAAVLVALAVIFVPVLLDGTGWRERRTLDDEIPPEPEFTFSRSLPTMDDARRDVVPPVPDLPEPRKEPVASYPVASSIAEPRPAEDTGEPAQRAPGPDAVAGEETVTAQRAAESAADPKKPAQVATAPQSAPSTSSRSGWVVQVGSFSSKRNAESLAGKLRKSGYRAFIEPVGSNASRRYRVKVGPEKDKAAALTTRSRLKSAEKLSGIVVRQR